MSLPENIDLVISTAQTAQASWAALPYNERAAVLRKAAVLI